MADAPPRADRDGLLPCPFCGARAVRTSTPEGLCGVECNDDTDYCTANLDAIYGTEREAAAAWNRRSTPLPTKAVAIAERLIAEFEAGQRRTDGSMAIDPTRERWYIADAYRLATAIVGAAGGSDDD